MKTFTRALRRAATLALLGASVGAGRAAAADVKTVAFPTVFFTAGAAVSPEARAAIPAEQGGQQFVAAVAQQFAGAADLKSLDQRGGFVASLRVSRGSTYLVSKLDGTTDAYAALTGTVIISDVATGDELFTFTKTQYIEKKFQGQPATAALVELYRSGFGYLVSALVQNAKDGFRPYEIAVTSKKQMGQLFVLDRGVAAGLAKGDHLRDSNGGELKVNFVGPAYATAQSVGAAPKMGVFSRTANKPLAELKRPRVMLIPSASNGEDLGAGNLTQEALGQILVDSLGAQSPFTIVEVDADAAAIRDILETQQAVSGRNLRTRTTPDFFLKLHVSAPIFFREPTNLAYKSRQTTTSEVQAEVLNKIGRVVFASSSRATITDDVTDGVAFDQNARAEIATKNAVAELAGKLAAAARFESLDLPVKSISGDTLAVDDTPGVLTTGSSPPVLHSLGQVDGVPGTVLAPTWEAHIDEEHGVAASASLVRPALYDGAPGLRAGDVLHVELFSPPSGRNRTRFSACGEAVSLGGLTLSGFRAQAMTTFAAASGQETYDPESLSQLSSVLTETGEFKDDLSAHLSKPPLCIEPVQRIDLAGEACDASGVCTTSVSLRLTYRVKRGDEIVYRNGLETTVRSKAYLRSISAQDKDGLVRADLAREATKMLADIVQQPAFKAAIAGL